MDDPDMALNLQDAIVGPGNLGFGVSSMASAAAAAEGDEYQQQQQQQPEDTPRIGNRGLLEPHRSKIAPDSMFGQGPWTPEIESTRDLRVDRKLRIVVPGWEGDFYDCDEVEWYLQQRGVTIPPAADFVTAEIDQDDFLGGQSAGPTKAFNATIDNFITDWLTKDFVSDGGTGGAVAAQLATPSASADTPMGENDLARAEGLVATHDGEPVTDKGKARHKAPAVPQVNTFTGGIPPVATPGKRLVNINVNTLVDELVSRSVCLGRTPGIRPKDLDGAFWSSVTLV